jgi:hypothetical protein
MKLFQAAVNVPWYGLSRQDGDFPAANLKQGKYQTIFFWLAKGGMADSRELLIILGATERPFHKHSWSYLIISNK